MITLVLAAALLAAGEPAATDAAKPAEAAAKTEKAPKVNKDGMVCKREAVLGSRMKQRVCMTQNEWEERQRQDRADLDRAQTNNPLTGN